MKAGVRAKVWDWASALCKHIKSTARWQNIGYNKRTFDAECLRALLELQGDCCALTRTRLLLPSLSHEQGTSIEAWRSALTPEQRGASVDAVRLDPDGDWVPGNIMLVAHMFAELYRCAGSLSKFKEMWPPFSNVNVVIYAGNEIGLQRAKRADARLQALARREEIPWT